MGKCKAWWNIAANPDEIQNWGDVALAIGPYELQVPTKASTLEVDRGKYVDHWRRISDGQFRVTVSMWDVAIVLVDYKLPI
jgi:hypothetical protein